MPPLSGWVILGSADLLSEHLLGFGDPERESDHLFPKAPQHTVGVFPSPSGGSLHPVRRVGEVPSGRAEEGEPWATCVFQIPLIIFRVSSLSSYPANTPSGGLEMGHVPSILGRSAQVPPKARPSAQKMPWFPPRSGGTAQGSSGENRKHQACC